MGTYLGACKNHKQARLLGYKYFYTGNTCPNGNIVLRRTSTNRCMCKPCVKQLLDGKKKYHEKVKNNPDFIKAREEYRNGRKEEKREYDRKYRARTPEKQKEWTDAWQAANPEKVRAIKQNYKARRMKWESNGVSSKELGKWIKKQKKICYWCGRKCDSDYHIDHYHPLAKGGSHSIENMVISCPTCNMRKKAKDPYEWAQEVGRLF